MLKSYGVVGGLQDFSVSPRPLGFWFLGLGLRGLGPGLDKNSGYCYHPINVQWLMERLSLMILTQMTEALGLVIKEIIKNII